MRITNKLNLNSGSFKVKTEIKWYVVMCLYDAKAIACKRMINCWESRRPAVVVVVVVVIIIVIVSVEIGIENRMFNWCLHLKRYHHQAKSMKHSWKKTNTSRKRIVHAQKRQPSQNHTHKCIEILYT